MTPPPGALRAARYANTAAVLGVLLIMGAALSFASLDSTTRYLGLTLTLPVALMLWGRYAFQALAMAVWLALSRQHGFRSAHPRFQVARGTLLLLTSGASFFGLQLMPVPEFTAIVMLTPLLVAVLVGWLLHERISGLRWALVAGGFAGALIVIRPGSGVFGHAVWLPLAGSLCYAFFQVLSSRMATLESPYTTHFYTGLVGAVAMTPVLAVSGIDVVGTLRAAPPSAIGWLLLMGFFGTVGHLLLILALGKAPTSTLMPFLYTQIGFAALIGWLAFSHLPDGYAWAGMAVIAACGATTAWLNVRARREPVPAVVADTTAD